MLSKNNFLFCLSNIKLAELRQKVMKASDKNGLHIKKAEYMMVGNGAAQNTNDKLEKEFYFIFTF